MMILKTYLIRMWKYECEMWKHEKNHKASRLAVLANLKETTFKL
jgi:hypothetical protein